MKLFAPVLATDQSEEDIISLSSP